MLCLFWCSLTRRLQHITYASQQGISFPRVIKQTSTSRTRISLGFVSYQTRQPSTWYLQQTRLPASALAITGAESLQWMKWCNKFTSFCIQVGGALLCGYAATFFMAIVSSLSAFSVLRLYSPKHFLALKGTQLWDLQVSNQSVQLSCDLQGQEFTFMGKLILRKKNPK